MTTPYIGEIRLFSWGFAPKNWAFCDGRLLGIQQNQALFSLLGTMYGGDGVSTFALPDLRGRAPIDRSSEEPQGLKDGTEQVSLSIASLPAHNHMLLGTSATGTFPGPSGHAFASDTSATVDFYAADSNPLLAIAPSTIAGAGSNLPHQNMQPYLVLNCCIALSGVFPSRN